MFCLSLSITGNSFCCCSCRCCQFISSDNTTQQSKHCCEWTGARRLRMLLSPSLPLAPKFTASSQSLDWHFVQTGDPWIAKWCQTSISIQDHSLCLCLLLPHSLWNAGLCYLNQLNVIDLLMILFSWLCFSWIRLVQNRLMNWLSIGLNSKWIYSEYWERSCLQDKSFV